MRLSSALGTKARLAGVGWRNLPWQDDGLGPCCGSAPPQIHHCNLIQRILPVPWHLLDVSLCFLVMLWQLLKTSWHLLATPWTHPVPFWHLPALVAPCPIWKLCPVNLCSHFNPPKANRVGKVWDHPQDRAPVAQLSFEHSLLTLPVFPPTQPGW